MTTILALLGNRWVRGLAVGAAFILLAFALDRCARYAMSGMQKSATEAGAQKERAETGHVTIKRMETADETRRDIRDERSRARYDECVLSARDAANCVRFLPE